MNLFFESCIKINNNLYPNYIELNPIDVVTYILDTPSKAEILDSGTNIFLDKYSVFDYIGDNSSRFRRLCMLAHDLRNKGWFIRQGINYGADFLLYTANPDNVHSKYAVYMVNSNVEEQWSHILGMNRVCVNAKKLMLLAVPDTNCETKFKYVELKRWIPESNRE